MRRQFGHQVTVQDVQPCWTRREFSFSPTQTPSGDLMKRHHLKTLLGTARIRRNHDRSLVGHLQQELLGARFLSGWIDPHDSEHSIGYRTKPEADWQPYENSGLELETLLDWGFVSPPASCPRRRSNKDQCRYLAGLTSSSRWMSLVVFRVWLVI